LPKLEFRKFGGDLKDWLPFRSQFQKIDQDEEIFPDDKFQYLVQVTVVGTRARDCGKISAQLRKLPKGGGLPQGEIRPRRSLGRGVCAGGFEDDHFRTLVQRGDILVFTL
jgi:hypothetical protein